MTAADRRPYHELLEQFVGLALAEPDQGGAVMRAVPRKLLPGRKWVRAWQLYKGDIVTSNWYGEKQKVHYLLEDGRVGWAVESKDGTSGPLTGLAWGDEGLARTFMEAAVRGFEWRAARRRPRRQV